jgi:hypothetical protein
MNKIIIGNFKLNEFVEREENIWACIYRGINRKKDIDDFDTDTEDKDETSTGTFKKSLSLRQPNKDSAKSLITDSALNSFDATRRHAVIEEELSFGDDESDSKEDVKDFSDHDSFSDSGSSSSHNDFNSSSNTSNHNKKPGPEALRIVKHVSDPKSIKVSKTNIKPQTQSTFKISRSVTVRNKSIRKSSMLLIYEEDQDVFSPEEQLVCHYI